MNTAIPTDTYVEVDFDLSFNQTTEVFVLVKNVWTGKVTKRGRDRKNAVLVQSTLNLGSVENAMKAVVAIQEGVVHILSHKLAQTEAPSAQAAASRWMEDNL